MIEIKKTPEFERWLSRLKDRKAKARIIARIDRIGFGNFGDFNSVGGGVNELRIFYGPGYRVFFVKRGNEIVVLLSGGDKNSQSRDIAKAKLLAEGLEVSYDH